MAQLALNGKDLILREYSYYRIMYMNSCVLILNEEEVEIVFFYGEELKVAEDLAWKMLD